MTRLIDWRKSWLTNDLPRRTLPARDFNRMILLTRRRQGAARMRRARWNILRAFNYSPRQRLILKRPRRVPGWKWTP